ncbi:ADP-ribosylglycohydrolase family protein [Acidithiobacillus caldus]|uniref:ADP-ribosylglycohydrolase n=1 Tax=Acidithiobacillus caldus TaxID=33059 RepID=A0A1E7YNU8_9PROT|nr:ADP-ribosylglycohydrolase family protein [Acidithiobacillus caldus]OFC36824.1 hypothetical protein BAE27_05230 [Acidithiobacillus caldus]OFC38888.1 hypothetical protein BAE28_04725 [Acidithiobacillus caldus]OFC40055.1 hypothetical protein BAE29_05960 [Acidithiobacillus caldus]
MTLDIKDRVWGGFLGGAIGDALGEPGESLPREERLQRWGPLAFGDLSIPMASTEDQSTVAVFEAEGQMAATQRGEGFAQAACLVGIHEPPA